MLRITEIEVWPQQDIRLYSSSGSVFHGALMECIGADVAERLHKESLRPYSQHIWFDKIRGCSVWQIGTVNDEAYECIVRPVLEKDCIYLKQKQVHVSLRNGKVTEVASFDGIADAMFGCGEVPQGVQLSFVTTTSFKHEGQYDIFPELTRVFYSLLQRWNQYAEGIGMEQEGLERILSQYCRVRRYELKSQPYALEHSVIYGFGGSMQVRFTGNDMTRRLAGALLSMAPYTGIGIKTALGMGAVRTQLIYAGKET